MGKITNHFALKVKSYYCACVLIAAICEEFCFNQFFALSVCFFFSSPSCVAKILILNRLPQKKFSTARTKQEEMEIANFGLIRDVKHNYLLIDLLVSRTCHERLLSVGRQLSHVPGVQQRISNCAIYNFWSTFGSCLCCTTFVKFFA